MADAAEYEAKLIANFERKLATICKPSDHPVWATESDARALMARTFKELGIREAWAPEIAFHWYGRGENASASRRAELRRVAVTEATQRRKVAQAEIKRQSVAVQERVLVSGLTCERAQKLLESLPTAKALMPELELEAIDKIAAPDRRAGLLDYDTHC